MPNYRRSRIAGGIYFFTVITASRHPLLCHPTIRRALRDAVAEERRSQPFRVIAWVLLPDHLHCVWELPLAAPLRNLPKGTLTVSIKDRQGNLSRIERTFSVAPE